MSSNIEITRVCEHCKEDFVAKTTTTRYCSHKCNNAAYKLSLKSIKIMKSDIDSAIERSQSKLELLMKAYYTIDDLSQIFGLSKRTFYRIIERGELPSAKLGGKTFVKKEAIEDLFKEEK
jgi:excisionase family DNA binding protein